jgi:hypothetical protein
MAMKEHHRHPSIPTSDLRKVCRRLAIFQAQFTQGLYVRDLNLKHVQLRPHQLQVKVGRTFSVLMQQIK